MLDRDEIYVLLGTSVFLAVMVLAGTADTSSKKPCNQLVYDAVYRASVTRALSVSTLTETDIALKNQAIQTLRQLCRGQRSTYELKNNTKALGPQPKKLVD